MDNYQLKVVADDLEFLSEWGTDITERTIRHGSGVLRRLLVEGVYGCAWRAIGFERQPKLRTVDLSSILMPDNLKYIEYLLAGGADYRGTSVATLCLVKGLPSEGKRPPSELLRIIPKQPKPTDTYPAENEFTIQDFVASYSGYIKKSTFTRKEVIKYVANVKGGVHLSAGQRKEEKKLVSRLARFEKAFKIAHTDPMLVEIVAIGQALGRSEDAHVYIRKAKEL